jgi:hypothetical protein
MNHRRLLIDVATYDPRAGRTDIKCYVKAHRLDVQIAAFAICSMPGPKVSEEASLHTTIIINCTDQPILQYV